MRDLMMLGAMFALVPMSLMNAYAAYLLWGWTGVMTPGNYLYGFMQPFRYNMLFAVITLCLIVLSRIRDKGRIRLTTTTMLLVLFGVHAICSATLGYAGNPFNWEYCVNLLKVLVFAFLMPLFMTSRLRIHAFLIALVLGLGLHGVLEGAKYLASGGGHHVVGIPMSMIGDNNHFAVALVMALPMAFYLFRYSRNAFVRLGFLGVSLLLVVAVIGTYSRGAFVCLTIVGGWFVISSNRKFYAAIVVSAAALAVVAMASNTWVDRIETIQNAGEDMSFMGRVSAWRASSAIALQHPFFGGGFHAVQVQYVWEKYRLSSGILPFVDMPEDFIRETARAAHSIYFEVLGDLGFVGFILFVSLLVNAQINCAKIRRLCDQIGPSVTWARNLANMLSISLIAYMVGGAAVTLGYYELVYILIMLIESIRQWLSLQQENQRRLQLEQSGI